MNTKNHIQASPEEVLARFGEPSEGRYGSWHTELVDALREALRQRDSYFQQWSTNVGRLTKERDEMRAALKWYARGRHIEHSHGHPSGTYLKVEDGERARQALAEQALDELVKLSGELGLDE